MSVDNAAGRGFLGAVAFFQNPVHYTVIQHDNPSSLDKQKVLSLLPIYNSKTLEQRVSKIL